MEIRPFDVRAAARTLAGDVDGVQQGLRRLGLAAEAVVLHPADPGLDRRTAADTVRALARLQHSAASLLTIARDLESAATDALAADRTDDGPTLPNLVDDGGALICRLPDSLRSSVDRRLTGMVGDTLTAAAVETFGALGSMLPTNDQGTSGDRGGRFSTRRVPLPLPPPPGAHSGGVPFPATDPSSAIGLTVAALDATADQTILAHDEFGLVDHGDEHYTVVLPGVTDLSRPEPGWNPVHRTPRDLDMAAIPSSRSADVADNVYARSVAEALDAVGVPEGAELVIVGHSFGADTALDLASDPAFTSRHRVSHVLATGYHSQPQLGSVAADTRVLVVQNRRDLVIGLGSAMPATETGVLSCAPSSTAGAHAVVVRFDGGLGGLGGLGHSIDVYRSVFNGDVELDPADADVVADFLDSIDRRPEAPDTMLAVDISLDP